MSISTSYEPIGNEKISKLNDNNSYKWSYEIKMLLQSKDLLKNIEYESLIEFTAKTLGNDLSESQKQIINEKGNNDNDRRLELIEKLEKKLEISKKDKMEWVRDDSRCVAIIGLSVSERYIPLIKESKNAFELWTKIKNELSTINNGQKLMLKCQFYDAKMTEKETLIQYLDKVVSICSKLEEIGCKTDESEICYKILSSIPEKYKAIKLTMLMMPEEDLRVA